MKLKCWTGWACLLALVAGLALSATNLVWGELNQDEGWYLYAAGQVAEGRLPYVDYAFTQGPVMPLIYAAADALVDQWGIAGGRLLTALLGILAALAAADLAGRLVARPWAGSARALALILLLVNVYHSYFTTVVKTYSLATLFLAAGFLMLSGTRRNCWAGPALAGICLAFAAGTRLSAGVVLPVAGLYLLAGRGHFGDRPWVAFGAGGGLALAAIFGPFAIIVPDSLSFGLWEYHAGRAAGSPMAWWAYKAGFVSRFVQAYFILCLLVVLRLLLGGFRLLRRPGVEALPETAAPAGFTGLLWLSALALTLVHGIAPFPYDDYQVMVVPLMAAALSGSLVMVLTRGHTAPLETGVPLGEQRHGWVLMLITLVFAACLAASFSSPINQSWMVRDRDRIWWPIKDHPDLQVLRNTAREIRAAAGSGDTLLTQDTYLAVEAGLSVPRGLEMGAFSYFPDMSDRRAGQLHVLNRRGLERLLATSTAPVAAISGYGFAMRCPDVQPLAESERQAWLARLEQLYEPSGDVPHFGQAHTNLRWYRLRPVQEESAP